MGIYIFYQYSKEYKSEKIKFGEKFEEKNVLQRTKNLILYDCLILLYIILLIFFVIWTIIGHIWQGNLSSNGYCRTQKSLLITMHTYSLIAMWIYLIGGFLLFSFTILITACDEGSCDLSNFCNCCCLCLTCGYLDLGFGKKKNKGIPVNYNNNHYRQERKDWIDSGKNFLQKIGILQKESRIPPMNNPSMPQNYNNPQPVV